MRTNKLDQESLDDINSRRLWHGKGAGGGLTSPLGFVGRGVARKATKSARVRK